eukprot:TRINITY_DN1430_c0_g1_i1.p1 TRINITY_DN1430_c0_g1~~TRINITY_DN1430_c0_g1_i1.p1  ORF type:complete len:253 (+),score=20.23 TRINITY_DN1430_c0_g1_i1:230-988(+)
MDTENRSPFESLSTSSRSCWTRRVKILVGVAVIIVSIVCVGLLIAYVWRDDDDKDTHPVVNLRFPNSFAWLVHIVEEHPMKNQTDFTEGQYFFDYTQKPIYATRQQNIVLPISWRPDIPYNIFFAVNYTIYTAYMDGAEGKVNCVPSTFSYTAELWPQDWSPLCKFVGHVQLPSVFHGRFNDARFGDEYQCNHPGFQGSFFFSHDNPSVVMRVSIQALPPMWNAQVWDTAALYEMPFPATYWQVPSWLNCTA